MKYLDIIKTIYINRYRQLTFKDHSAFWIPIILYFIFIYKIFDNSFPQFPQFDVSNYVLIIFSFSISNFINNRNDWQLLNSILSKQKVYLIYFFDLIIGNFFNLFVSTYCDFYIAFYSIIIFILFFTFYRIKPDKPILKIPFKILDVLNIIAFRKFKLNFIAIFICYYIIYQSLIELNLNLFTIINIVLIYIIIGNTSKSENISYFILSKQTNIEYILRNEFAVIINSFILLAPSLVTAIYIQPNFVIIGLCSLLIIPIIYPLKYINFSKNLIIQLTQLLCVAFFLSLLLDNDINYLYFLVIIILSIAFHFLAFKKFTKEIIKNNSEFYL